MDTNRQSKLQSLSDEFVARLRLPNWLKHEIIPTLNYDLQANNALSGKAQRFNVQNKASSIYLHHWKNDKLIASITWSDTRVWCNFHIGTSITSLDVPQASVPLSFSIITMTQKEAQSIVRELDDPNSIGDVLKAVQQAIDVADSEYNNEVDSLKQYTDKNTPELWFS